MSAADHKGISTWQYFVGTDTYEKATSLRKREDKDGIQPSGGDTTEGSRTRICMSDSKLKLTIELVPSNWGINLANMLKEKKWNEIRKKMLDKYENKCAICGSVERLCCHEKWKYDDQRHIQKLTGFIILCSLCHGVKHIGRTEGLAKKGKLDYEIYVKHFMKVNNCDRSTFEKHRNAAFKEWEERRKYTWNMDFGRYKGYLGKGVVDWLGDLQNFMKKVEPRLRKQDTTRKVRIKRKKTKRTENASQK